MKSTSIKFTKGQASQATNAKLANLEKARAIKNIKKKFLKPSFSRGHKFTENEKADILHIYHSLQMHPEFGSLQGSDFFHLTALLYGCTKPTVVKLVENEGKVDDGRINRFNQNKDIPIHYRDMFKDSITESLQRGVRLTCTYFKQILFEDGIFVSGDTVARKLREWGLRWGSLTQRDFRRRTTTVLSKREIYLNDLEALERDQTRERVYLDESFVHKNHSFSKGWFISDGSKEIFKPTGLGPRIAMIAAITQGSWLGTRPQNIKTSLSVARENNLHYYKAIKYWQVQKDSENEGNVNYEVFRDYFEEFVIPFLPPRSIIILDNARYHRQYPPDTFIPATSSNKSELIEYLQSQGEKTASQEMTKSQLLELSKSYFKATAKNEIEQIAEAYGHNVLYLPPYHPELNPIEFTWGYVKRKVADASAYDMHTLSTEILPSAFASVTPEILNKFFQHIKNNEQSYREIIRKEKEARETQMIIEEDQETENCDFLGESFEESSGVSDHSEESYYSDNFSDT